MAESMDPNGPLRVDGDRLWASLMEMARIGATKRGGVSRLALTDLDRQSRELFIQWCEQAGCQVTVDRIGNLFARREGRDPTRPPIVIGSHLDSQPTGGKFDGVYGVLAGLEVIRSLNDREIVTEAPVEVAVWTNEEGARFDPAMLGSGVFAGVFTTDSALETKDVDGISIGDALQEIGFAGPLDVGGREFGAHFEAHIEQGPILEREDLTIGVVTGVQGIRWFDLIVEGNETHAGPTPMELRQDPVPVATRTIDAVFEIAQQHAPDSRATVGVLASEPSSRNTVPSCVRASVDLRHPDAKTLDEMTTQLRALAQQQESEGVSIQIKDIWESPPVVFDSSCVEAVRHAAGKLGLSHRDIVSGAGHDSVYIARVAPTAMIFVPCKNGVSHNEEESATPQDLAAGASVLLEVVADFSNRSRD